MIEATYLQMATFGLACFALGMNATILLQRVVRK